MRTDIDQLFRALGAHAERIPLGTAESARRRGDRRRRHRLATVAAVVLTAGAVSATTVWLKPQPAPVAGVPFVHLVDAGHLPADLTIPVPETHGGLFADVKLLDGVAYTADQRKGGPVQLGALDLNTGAYTTVERDESFVIESFYVSPHGVLVAGTRAGESATVIAVVEPVTLAPRWERDLGGGVLAVGSVIAAYDPEAGVLSTLDWRTGEAVWERDVGAVQGITPVYASTPGLLAPAGTWPTELADDRLLVVGPTGTLEVVDALTGTMVGRVDVDRVEHAVAIGGSLYVTSGRTTLAFTIDGSAGPVIVHSGNARVMPCGANLVCLMPVTGGVLVFDNTTHEKVGALPYATEGTVVGDRFLSHIGALYDLSGTLLGATPGEVQAWWITADSALTISRSGPTATVWGIAARDGSAVSLGTIPAPTSVCAVDQRHLVCAIADGFQAWRFAE